MSLNNEQIESVRQWVAEGADVGEVQTRIKSQFGISMSYMDVRFLIDDIGAEIVSKPEKPEPEVPQDLSAQPSSAYPEEAAYGEPAQSYPDAQSGYDAPETEAYSDGQGGYPSSDGGYPEADVPEASQAGGDISVSVSPIQRPDCIVSGDVVFSDGTKAEWRIDRMGQLGLIPEAGKTPPQSDMYPFQRKLQELLSRM